MTMPNNQSDITIDGKHKAKIRGVVYTVPDQWTINDVTNFWNNSAKGLIQICPVCDKIDVFIEHFAKCNPVEEYERQLAQEASWK